MTANSFEICVCAQCASIDFRWFTANWTWPHTGGEVHTEWVQSTRLGFVRAIDSKLIVRLSLPFARMWKKMPPNTGGYAG